MGRQYIDARRHKTTLVNAQRRHRPKVTSRDDEWQRMMTTMTIKWQ